MLKKRIQKVEAPPERLEDVANEMERGRSIYCRMFKNAQEFEYFWMLPLSNEQRQYLLTRLWQEKQEQKELEECTGHPDSSDEHRSKCISCCKLFPKNMCQ